VIGFSLPAPNTTGGTVDFFDRLEASRARWNVLEHPFYLRWSAGELTRKELACYAGEYRHAAEALATALANAARSAEPGMRDQLEEHAAEEADHVGLWNQFALAVGADGGREPREETSACVRAWTAGADTLEGLAVAYAIESAQPEISRVKLEGLLRHYGVQNGPATEYFELHAERDREHAAQTRELIEQEADGTSGDGMLRVAEGALRGNWLLLDGDTQRAARA
jgi:pyrroloquinoline-quinone synthase